MNEPSDNPNSEIRNPKSVIGLVGGIGSGKSLVAQMLAEHGGIVIEGDVLGHEALRQPAIRAQVAAHFGPGVLDENGEVARRKLAERVFRSTAELRALEALVFPYIRRQAEVQIAAAQAERRVRFIVLDAAVMLEARWNTVCDRLVYVHAPRAVRLARLARRGWTEAQVVAREQSQWPLADKARRCDVAIDNGGDRRATADQVIRLIRDWKLACDAGK